MYCPNPTCFIKGTTGKFCCNCGKKLVEDLRCECKSVVNSDKFCRSCGKEQGK